MKNWRTPPGLTALILLLLAGSTCLGESVVFRDGQSTWTYQKRSSHGWTIYLQVSLLENKTLIRDLNTALDKSLAYIATAVPERPLRFLQTIPIWVSNEPTYPMRKGEKGVIPFHRSKGWLRNHGLNPHMAPGFHVINPGAVLYVHKMFDWGPLTILHELSHAYHNLHLKLKHPAIKQAYENAMARGLYLQVPARGDPKRKAKAYAATNQEEYFDELTEAYFGRNDWFPHNREQLQQYDSAGYAMIEQVWEIRPGGTSR